MENGAHSAAANTVIVATSNNHPATYHFVFHLHLGWLVSGTTAEICCQILTRNFSVVLVSIIWIVVLAKLEATDVTCTLSPLSH